MPLLDDEVAPPASSRDVEPSEGDRPQVRVADPITVQDPTVDALREMIHELRSKLGAAVRERDDARRELELVRKQGLASAEPAAAPKATQVPSEDLNLPEDWDALFSWAHQHFDGKIAFTSRARRVARKSVFRDIPQVASAVAMLANEYHDLLTIGGDDCRRAFDARCAELGVSIGVTGAATDNHRTAESYTATWNGKGHLMERHVQGSSSRDASRGLRIYFAQAEGVIVIGHLPTHLRNSLT